MALPVWGNLEKSQIDNEKIEEAIARLIQVHDDDANAHLDAGQSLNSHKASEIIDHLVASIIADKIGDMEVTDHKMKFDKFIIKTNFESMDTWTKYTFGSGDIEDYLGSERLKTGATINSIADIHNDAWLEGYGIDYTKNPRFMTVLLVTSDSDQESYVVAGSFDNQCFGFFIREDAIFALHMKDYVEYKTDTGITVTTNQWYRLKAVYTSGLKIEFYIDDVLVATHTTNLPEDSADADAEITYFRYQTKTIEAANKELHIRHLTIVQDT